VLLIAATILLIIVAMPTIRRSAKRRFRKVRRPSEVNWLKIQRTPDALGGRRHFQGGGGLLRQRVGDRIHDGARRRRGAGFAGALDAERMVVHGTITCDAWIDGITSARGIA